jgi:RHS repeat-associated protein
MTSGNAHYLFYALDRDSHPLLRVEFRYRAPDFQVRADAVIDNWSWSQTAWVTISDAPHLLELDWQANNGVLTFWVDEVQQGSFTNLDNDTRLIDFVQWGIVGGVDIGRSWPAGSRGTLYLDAFESRRDSYIGPLAGLLGFEVALGGVHAQAVRWLGPAWNATQVTTRDLAASLAAHFRPTVLQSPAEITSTAEGPALVLETATIQYTTVLAPLTLEARTTSIKVLAAPPPAEPARPHPALRLASGYATTRTISYTYDPLYRLTRANYSDGTNFRYTYDAVGNRLSEEATGGTVNSYAYDAANRLASVDGVPYAWDANGNLLDDGSYTYSYDHANRLKTVNGPEVSASYAYNGLGVRVQETAGGTTTHYVVNPNAGLTQVLSDGTNTYLYGVGRIAQESTSGVQYFLADALGSVRQLVDANGSVQMVKSYEPYGEVLLNAGDGATDYGFTGEWTDDYIELVNLRSRLYSPSQGRFISKDTWPGMFSRPLTLNKWLYVSGNPINLIDPSGFIEQGEAQKADSIANDLRTTYNVLVNMDWGQTSNGYGLCSIAWNKGAWNLQELEWVQFALERTATKLGGATNADKFKSAMGRSVRINRVDLNDPIRSFAPPGPTKYIFGDVVLTNYGISDEFYVKHLIIHELGHVWDENNHWKLSTGMMQLLGTEVCTRGYGGLDCRYDVLSGKELPVGDPPNPYPNDDEHLLLPRNYQGPWEDWADSFAVYVFPDYFASVKGWNSTLGPIRRHYIYDQIQNIP